MEKFGTVGPYDYGGDWIELDWKWDDYYEEAEITEVRVNGVKVETSSIAEHIIDSLFEEVPYDKLMESE